MWFILLSSQQDPEFHPDLVASKSYAAAGLCSWVLNIVKFYEVYCEVEPKRQALSKANAELAAAQEKLSAIKTKIIVSWGNKFIAFGQTPPFVLIRVYYCKNFIHPSHVLVLALAQTLQKNV